MSEQKLTELLNSGEQANALESALRALPGGNEAIEVATAAVIAAVIALRDTPTQNDF